MNKNTLNKNLIIYKIQNLKINTFNLILISLKKGFLVIPLKYNKNIQLDSLFFGYNRLYKFFFKLKGFGFKWKYLLTLKKQSRKIYLKLGFTHRISLITKNNNIKIKLKKRRLIIKTRSYDFLRNNLNFLFFLYKTYLYNKKGIYLRGTKFKLKISKKKSKF